MESVFEKELFSTFTAKLEKLNYTFSIKNVVVVFNIGIAEFFLLIFGIKLWFSTFRCPTVRLGKLSLFHLEEKVALLILKMKFIFFNF